RWAMPAGCSTSCAPMRRWPEENRTMKVAINGFGRIGRSVFRILDKRPNIEVVAINDIFDPAALLYLLRYDTVMGGFSGPLALEDGCVVTAHARTKILAEKDPTKLPWRD